MPAAIPPVSADAEFTLSGLHALLKLALSNTGKAGDFQHVMARFGGDLPSAALRRRMATFLEDRRTAELPAAKSDAA
jgi:hypothetical protein